FDLKKPVGERNGAWPFPFFQWIPQAWIKQMIRSASKRSEEAMTREMSKLLDKNPALRAILPILLERGDPTGREFALRTASQLGLPILADFARSQNGTDQDRIAAMNA